MKYVVRIDLTLPHFKPGRKSFERVRWCLNERLDLKFDFLVTWVPHGNCPLATSLAAVCGFHITWAKWYAQILHVHWKDVIILPSDTRRWYCYMTMLYSNEVTVWPWHSWARSWPVEVTVYDLDPYYELSMTMTKKGSSCKTLIQMMSFSITFTRTRSLTFSPMSTVIP